jgi:hypothetical protein
MSIIKLQAKVDSIRSIIDVEIDNPLALVEEGILERSAYEILNALDMAVTVVQSAAQHILLNNTNVDELIKLIDEVHDEIQLIKKKR